MSRTPAEQAKRAGLSKKQLLEQLNQVATRKELKEWIEFRQKFGERMLGDFDFWYDAAKLLVTFPHKDHGPAQRTLQLIFSRMLPERREIDKPVGGGVAAAVVFNVGNVDRGTEGARIRALEDRATRLELLELEQDEAQRAAAARAIEALELEELEPVEEEEAGDGSGGG